MIEVYTALLLCCKAQHLLLFWTFCALIGKQNAKVHGLRHQGSMFPTTINANPTLDHVIHSVLA